MKKRKQKRLIIIPEDSNTSQLAEGFIQNEAVNDNRCYICPYASGWKDAAEISSALRLGRNTDDYVLLLIDFDRHKCDSFDDFNIEKRKEFIAKIVGGNVPRDRLFILGARSETEPFKQAMHRYFRDGSLSYEGIGCALAKECSDRSVRVGAWGEDELVHNMDEIARIEEIVKPFLFD